MRTPPRTRWPAWLAAVGVLTLGTLSGARSPAAAELHLSQFRLLSRGMSESEVLARAGPPDHVSRPARVARRVTVTRDTRAGRRTVQRYVEPRLAEWSYVPGPGVADPWITVVHFRGGRVSALERTKVFTRAPARSTPAPATRAAPQEPAAARADRVLDAALEYAAIRARLKSALDE